jgi:beta-lactamase regulating signal transducer with metallopeptidase domain
MQAGCLHHNVGGAAMLGWFAETTLVASGLAVVAALAGRLRSISPTVRHALWLVVLIKLMTPPLVSWPWAVPWWDLDWPLLSPGSAHAAVVAVGDGVGDDRSSSTGSIETSTLTDLARMMGPGPARAGRGELRSLTPCEVAALVLEPPPAPEHVTVQAAPALSRPRGPAGPSSLAVAVASARWILAAWLVVSVLLAVGQANRIIRFRRRLRAGVPAPDDLVEEAEQIGWRLGVRTPELLVVSDLGTPLLWCLGRPKLLLPLHLVKTLPLDRWRGILTHELAHLRRGDHWVSRLELVAGFIWWWNPLYWLTRARLDAEAELACDAWVVWALPKDRLTYAEALFEICATLSLVKSPAPALGAAGAGRFFERRLTMILHEPVPCRLSRLGFLGAWLLVLFALPSWSAAKPVSSDLKTDPASTTAAIAPTADQVTVASVVDDDDGDEKGIKDDDDDDDEKGVKDDDDDDDDDKDNADDDDDDDDEDDKAVSRAKAKAKADAKKAKAEVKARAKEKAKKLEGDVDTSRIEKEIESKFGADFEKKMEALGEKIGKEIEAKFGPDFEKKMEALGKEIEAKFGPEFEKKMEALGKEIEAKFGSGSDFEKKMKALGKEMEAKFGSGSDFEKKMKDLGKEMEAKFGPESEFMKTIMKEVGSDSKGPKKATAPQGRARATRDQETSAAGRAGGARRRERRIAELEAQISKLAEELKALRAETDRGEE